MVRRRRCHTRRPALRHGPRERALLRTALAGLTLVLFSGCGGASFDGRVFKDDDLNFQVGDVPSAWRQVDASHSQISFRDEQASATVAVSARCGQDGDDVPLTALTHHLFLSFTEREMLSQEEQMLDGRAVLRTEIEAKLDGVRKHFVTYVLKKDSCVYDFVHISPPGAPARSRQEFDAFVTGFRTLP